LTGWGLTALSA